MGVRNPARRGHKHSITRIEFELTSAEDAAGVTIVNAHYAPGNVLRYGTNTTPGTTDMSAAAQAALDQAAENEGASVYFPAQEYLVSTKLAAVLTGANDHERIRIYGDGQKTIITSTVVGDTTLEINDGQFVTVERMRFVGNTLTGASGNGHAVAFRDSNPQSGTVYPQQCDIRDVYCTGFRGDDEEVTGSSTGVATTAAGIYMGPGLGNYVDRCSLEDNGIGVLMDECANSHVTRTLVTGSDEYGIEWDSPRDGNSMSECDLTSNGVDTNGDPVVVSGSVNYSNVGVIGNTANSHTVDISKNKSKSAQFLQIHANDGVKVHHNYIRVDPADTIAGPTYGIKAFTCEQVEICSNEFEYLVVASNTKTTNAVLIDMNASHPCTVIFNYNSFNHRNDVGYDVQIEGASTSDSDICITMLGNKFGSPRHGRTDSTVTDCVVITTCNYHGIFAANTFTVLGDNISAGGTITDCIDVSGAAAADNNNLFMLGNKSRVYLTGGTITNPIEDVQLQHEVTNDGLLIERGKTLGVEDSTGSDTLKLKETGSIAQFIASANDIGLYPAGSLIARFRSNYWQAEVPVLIKERTAAVADVAGFGQIWVKDTTPCQLWFTDDAGTDTQIV